MGKLPKLHLFQIKLKGWTTYHVATKSRSHNAAISACRTYVDAAKLPEVESIIYIGKVIISQPADEE